MSTELRRAALGRAERMRSPRAAEVLRRAELEVRERSAWESSDGTVRAVDVHLLVDGYALGLVRGHPAVGDAVIEAVTAAAPDVLEASVIDLSFEWALREQSGADRYRDAALVRVDRRSSVDVGRALAAFLAAFGDEDAARLVEAGTLRVERGGGLAVSFDPRRVEGALEALFGARPRVRRDRS